MQFLRLPQQNDKNGKFARKCIFTLKHLAYLRAWGSVSWNVFFVSDIVRKSWDATLERQLLHRKRTEWFMFGQTIFATAEAFIAKVTTGSVRRGLPDTWRSVSGVGSRCGSEGNSGKSGISGKGKTSENLEPTQIPSVPGALPHRTARLIPAERRGLSPWI